MSETDFKYACIRYVYLKHLRKRTQNFTDKEAGEMLDLGDKIITYCITKFAQEEQEQS